MDYRTVLSADGRGRVVVGAVTFPITPGMLASQWFERFFASVFADERRDGRTG